MDYLSWIGIILFTFGALGIFLVADDKSGKSIAIITLCMCVLIGSFLLMYEIQDKERNKAYKQLNKEINMQQVSVKGQNVFHAQIEIIYKDGTCGVARPHSAANSPLLAYTPTVYRSATSALALIASGRSTSCSFLVPKCCSNFSMACYLS